MYKFFKRLLDITVSLVTLIILLPVFIPIIIILRFSAEGEVFYFQERYGIHNSRFQIWKFATMLKNSMNIGTGSITLQNDPRVTKIGSFLRKTKINELPQIFNVIIGSMSIVGPRPQMEVDFNKFPPNTRNLIYKSKPGITGIGSIVFRDEEDLLSNFNGDKHEFYKNKIAPYKTNLELWYFKNRSLFLDFSLIIITAWVIFFPKSKILYKVYKSLPDKPKN